MWFFVFRTIALLLLLARQRVKLGVTRFASTTHSKAALRVVVTHYIPDKTTIYKQLRQSGTSADRIE